MKRGRALPSASSLLSEASRAKRPTWTLLKAKNKQLRGGFADKALLARLWREYRAGCQEVDRCRQQVVDGVVAALSEDGALHVELFGSNAQGLAIASSDVDLNCALDDCETVRQRILDQCPAARDMQVISNARIPIVKFVVNDISFDVVCGNRDELEHGRAITKWIRSAMERTAGLADAIRFMKRWARCRGLLEPRRGTLPSLAILVLAARQKCKAGTSSDEQSVEIIAGAFATIAEGNLLTNLLYDRDAPSATLVAGAESERIERLQTEHDDFAGTGFGTRMFILDPIIGTINLARFVDDRTITRIRDAFREAHDHLLQATADDNVFERLARSPSGIE
ncbi:polymerase nucleotidyl transferase domain-containing protein [Plasmodiophora brassicae]